MRRTWHHNWLRGIVATLALVSTIGMSADMPTPAALAQGNEAWGERAPMLLPRSEASVAELNGKMPDGAVYPEMRGDRQSSSACLAWSESWVKPRG